jgi:hypothetical protein
MMTIMIIMIAATTAAARIVWEVASLAGAQEGAGKWLCLQARMEQ